MERDERRWMRDLGALLALPSLWVDHAPAEIADGLLGVLVGMLRLDAVSVRFDGSGAGPPVVAWRPAGPEPPAVLGAAPAPETVGADAGDDRNGSPPTGVRTSAVRDDRGGGIARVATLSLALPWGSGVVVASADRGDFPTEREAHLLRVAVGQAAIALHTARRLAAEQRGRREAERELARQSAVLRSLLDELSPVLSAATRRIREAGEALRDDAEAGTKGVEAGADFAETGSRPEGADTAAAALTRRELEVLGLLAQGLSNKEIAGVMWLSDRTVERHITSLYRKIGVARRSEATAFALRHGIA
jgi:DNA-binding CsgD family transcriptional regulator